MIYYFLPQIKNFFAKLPGWMILLSVLMLLTHLILAKEIPAYPLGAGFYVNLALMAFVIAQLATLESDNDLIKRIDTFLGNLSYPLFLTHSLAGFVVSLMFIPHLQYGLPLLKFGYPVAVLVSILISKYIDEPIQVFRVRRRNRNTARTMPS
jgi:peptidoglycan/LPS O-acetylase OafA/YrhL